MNIAHAYPILSQMLGNDEKQILRILDMILDGLKTDLEKLSEATKSHDRELVADSLHRMTSNLGLIKLDRQLAIMPRSRDENLWDRLPIFVDSLKEELENQYRIKWVIAREIVGRNDNQSSFRQQAVG
ncbi:MAG: hypothetical protein AAF391_02855 [Bacteroidota bacterium]